MFHMEQFANQFVAMKDLVARLQQKGVAFKKTDKSQRNALMKELHELYLADKLVNDKKNCATWLSRRKMKPLVTNVDKWKKESGEFKTPITPASLASFWLCHMKTEDLFYLISIAKDKANRKESFNKWLFWSINPKFHNRE